MFCVNDAIIQYLEFIAINEIRILKALMTFYVCLLKVNYNYYKLNLNSYYNGVYAYFALTMNILLYTCIAYTI